MKKKITSACIMLVNLLGVICLIYCMILYVNHDVTVVNPDTMLLMEAWNQTSSQQEEMLETIGIDISSGTVVEFSDSHGGFHGNGLLFEIITFDNDSIAQQLAEQEGWKALTNTMIPMSLTGIPSFF